MNIQKTSIDAVNAVLTLQVEKADYQEKVEKTLRDYRKKANIPGFRPGMVPAGLVKKMYGKAVLVEEINKLVSEQLFSYIKDNQIDMLGEPLPNADQQEIDFDNAENFEFKFDIALAPKFELAFGKKDKVKSYDIEVEDTMVENQIKSYTGRFGSYLTVDSAEPTDIIRGHAVELTADGQVKEGGINAEHTMLTPSYMKDEAEKAKFAGVKPDDVIVFNPQRAFQNEHEIGSLLKISKEEAKEITADFQLTITAITRYKEAEINQDLYNKVYGEGVVTTEEAFRQKIGEGIKETLLTDSAYKFGLDVKELIFKKLEGVEFPETFLKRWALATNDNLTEEKLNEDFPKMIESLKWELSIDRLAKANSLQVEADDITRHARNVAAAQFAQYGMMSVPDDVLDNYAKDMLKKQDTARNLAARALEEKVFELIKTQVTLDTKKITIEKFNKLFEEK